MFEKKKAQQAPNTPPPQAPANIPAPAAADDMLKMMWLAGGIGLNAVISQANSTGVADSMDPASERAGGESRRTGLKRKAADITRSVAEDFALLTSRTTSESQAADFLSTVANVRLTLKHI